MNKTKLFSPFLTVLALLLLLGTYKQISNLKQSRADYLRAINTLTISSQQLHARWGANRLYYPKLQEFCGSYEESPTKITLYPDGKLDIKITPLPDLSYDKVKLAYQGQFSIRDGALIAHLQSPIGWRPRVLMMPIQHLDHDGSIASFNLENEMTQRACP